jgi:hypothetical protein
MMKMMSSTNHNKKNKTNDPSQHVVGGGGGGMEGLEGLLQSLRKQTIRELKIGWHDCDYLRGPRNTALVVKAVQNNTSLTHVMIGWRRRHLSYTLRLLQALSATRARLLYLDLSLDDAIPASILAQLLAGQQHLVEIHIRAVRVYNHGQHHNNHHNHHRHHNNHHGHHHNNHNNTNTNSNDLKRQLHYRSIVEDCILSQYHALPHWKVLSLTDCDLTDADLLHLADFLHIRGGLAELRLRSNRQISGAGLLHILQAPVMKKLDVSLCDLQPEDGLVMANALKQRPWPLDQLILVGNYRLGSGAVALVQSPCVEKIRSLDLSYSVHTDSIFASILAQLGQSLHCNNRAVLQRIAIHGAWNETTAVESLAGLLWQQQRTKQPHNGSTGYRNCSLRSLQLNNPHAPIRLSVPQVQSLEYALRENYDLEDLGLDYPIVAATPSSPATATVEATSTSTNAVHDLHFWLRLNSAGRRIVQQPPPPDRNNSNDDDRYGGPNHTYHTGTTNNSHHDEWLEVVEKAGQDSLTVLYWIIRNSAERFGR